LLYAGSAVVANDSTASLNAGGLKRAQASFDLVLSKVT